MSNFDHLFQPIKIGALELPNRIVMSPMGTNFSEEIGMPTERMAAYYGERAKGGTGLIIVEGATVQLCGMFSPKLGGLWDDKFISGWKKVVDAIHSRNAKAALQVAHLGRSTSSEATGGLQPVAPSPVPCHMFQEIPHELSTDEVYQFIDDFVAAVKRATKAGFDAIEIHGTHGYLIASFMSGKTNKRTDEFGGTLQGRLKLPIEIIRRVRKEVGPDYPILMRIGSDEPKGGRTVEETKVIAKILANEGIDALNVSRGTMTDFEWEVPPYFMPPAFNMMNIEAIKRSVEIPVIACGLIHEPEMAEQIIAEGRADMVGIGRALIADPHWANKVKEGRSDEIHTCTACTRCIDELFLSEDRLLKCTVNPLVGKEWEWKTAAAGKKKKVMVVGGGPAGLQAASSLAERGHEVILYEREGMLGGQVRSGAIPPDKYRIASVIRWAETEARKHGVRIETGKEVTPETVQQIKPDAVILATGAHPQKIDVPGIENSTIILANDVLLGKGVVGKKVLIIGGGTVGCETAHFLAEYGKSITIVEMLDEIGTDLGFIPRPIMLEKLTGLNVEMITSARVVEILPDGVLVERNGQKERLSGFETIVMAVGSTPDNQLYGPVKEMIPEVYLVGDANKPGKILEALTDAIEVAQRI